MRGSDSAVGEAEESEVGRLLVCTRSVEEAEARGAHLLSPHRLKVGKGGLHARIRGISSGPVALYQLNYATGITVAAPPMHGYVDIMLPIHGIVRVDHDRTCFDAVAGRTAGVISPTAPMVLRWSPDLSLAMLRIKTDVLQSFASTLSGRHGVELRLDPRVTSADTVAGLYGAARLIRSTAVQFAGASAWPAAINVRLREQAMLALLLSQPRFLECLAEDVRQPLARKAVHAAIELIESAPVTTLTTAGLAAAVGVSVRTLQVGFRAELDISPSTYLLNVRLRRVRDELATARPDDGATVGAIAHRWGFRNLGRFAAQYRGVHGEHPSDTLRRV